MSGFSRTEWSIQDVSKHLLEVASHARFGLSLKQKNYRINNHTLEIKAYFIRIRNPPLSVEKSEKETNFWRRIYLKFSFLTERQKFCLFLDNYFPFICGLHCIPILREETVLSAILPEGTVWGMTSIIVRKSTLRVLPTAVSQGQEQTKRTHCLSL